jgi:hypothetical protein
MTVRELITKLVELDANDSPVWVEIEGMISDAEKVKLESGAVYIQDGFS